VGVIGNDRPLDKSQVERYDGVERVVPILAPYKLASLEVQPVPTLVPLNGLKVGSGQIALIAGPCSVESREQILEAAQAVKSAGATALRGGASGRTSPYSFQGWGWGLVFGRRRGRDRCLVTEVMALNSRRLPSTRTCCKSRNMQNLNLRAVGETRHPVRRSAA
jgi:3-deoxy-7-phosphoheptulonate synthase